MALTARPALADEAQPERRLHVIQISGAYLATAAQRDTLEDAILMGMALGLDVNPYLAVVASFSWAPTKVKGLENGDLDLFQCDLGLQAQYPVALGRTLVLNPFVGAGLGARTYRYRDLDIGSETDLSGYVAAGGALQNRFAELVITARENLSAYNGLGLSDVSTTRNDVYLSMPSAFGSSRGSLASPEIASGAAAGIAHDRSHFRQVPRGRQVRPASAPAQSLGIRGRDAFTRPGACDASTMGSSRERP